MARHIYEISAEVRSNADSPIMDGFAGAFIYVYVPANGLEESIVLMKSALKESSYELLDIEYCAKLDFDDWEAAEDFPSVEELLDCLDTGEITFSPLFGYDSPYKH